MSNESLLPVILIQLCCYSNKDSNGTPLDIKIRRLVATITIISDLEVIAVNKLFLT